jgi:hypothetical protein
MVWRAGLSAAVSRFYFLYDAMRRRLASVRDNRKRGAIERKSIVEPCWTLTSSVSFVTRNRFVVSCQFGGRALGSTSVLTRHSSCFFVRSAVHAANRSFHPFSRCLADRARVVNYMGYRRLATDTVSEPLSRREALPNEQVLHTD